jgi:EAL domain-containing protein (putative c-di-GMP-specific phosphodiesterase class I)
VLEITESAIMDDPQRAMQTLERLHAMGLKLSIDDFGTGYSSLAYLRKLPARQLKIDRSFVQDVDREEDAKAIVRAVIKLAHALSLEVVAEGVETEAQQDILVRMGCDQLQGFRFAKPMPADKLLAWMRSDERPARKGYFDQTRFNADEAVV